MKYVLTLAIACLVLACSTEKKEAEEQSGSATSMLTVDVIDADLGYIIENAALASGDEDATYSVKGAFKLRPGNSQVLVVRTQSREGGFTELLALEYPDFVEGTRAEFSGDDLTAGFWVYGIQEKREVIMRTGKVSGFIRLTKLETAPDEADLARDVKTGSGEMEIVVSDIEHADLPLPAEKKYAAKFSLPVVSLAEYARINQEI